MLSNKKKANRTGGREKYILQVIQNKAVKTQQGQAYFICKTLYKSKMKKYPDQFARSNTRGRTRPYNNILE